MLRCGLESPFGFTCGLDSPKFQRVVSFHLGWTDQKGVAFRVSKEGLILNEKVVVLSMDWTAQGFRRGVGCSHLDSPGC